jgi:2-(1,2-epoxy-1,2-dihydrophenyl)acetyl-CoA isomerase
MSYQNIRLEIAEGVATVTLNRPERLNAFTVEMHAELREALKRIQRDKSVRCLLITGAGRGFCAGQDLSARKREPGAPPPDLGESLERNYNPLIRSLRSLELPVVAAVNGVAAGSGANLALACDIVLAARSASFVESFARIGLIPDAGGTWSLPRLLGQARAMGLALLGEKLPAEQAEAWGLIWRCVDDDQLMQEATALAQRLAKQPTKGLALTKRAINAAWANSLPEQLDLERDLQRLAGRTDDYREGVTAFMEKREPTFKGS